MEDKENKYTDKIPSEPTIHMTPEIEAALEAYVRGYRDGQRDARENPWRDTQPIPSSPVGGPVKVCPTCRIEWSGVMLYSCPNRECPIQPKVTC